MDRDPSLRCPCGVAAPPELPPMGGRPVACWECGTPLVRPARAPALAVERGLGAALLVAVALAAGWVLLARETRDGVPWVVLVAGALVGLAARFAARSRGRRVQVVATVSLVVFLALGEFLLYHHALGPRLEAMHAREGASDPRMLAEEELRRMDLEKYVFQIESSMPLFVCLAAAAGLVLWITRAPPAVAAFRAPAPPVPAEDADGGLDVDAPAPAQDTGGPAPPEAWR